MLIARFDGDVDRLAEAYDRGHALIMSRGGAVAVGELRHHCAISTDSLYIIGVWESEEALRARWADEDFKQLLSSVGFPDTPDEFTVLDLLGIELHVTSFGNVLGRAAPRTA